MKICNQIGALAIVAAIMGIIGAARADDTLYQTGFESPTYLAGQPIVGQNTWMEYAGGGNGAGLITTNQPASGQQSLQINGGAITFLPMYGFYDVDYSPNPTWNFSQYPIVRLEAQIRLDGPSTGSTLADDLISANFDVGNQDGLLGQMWISSNGHVHYYSDADPGPTDDGYLGPAVTLGHYHDLTFLLNTGTLTDSFYVDGQYIASLAMSATAISDDSFAFDLSMVGVADQPGYDHTQYTAYYDNVTLTAVPEPGVSAFMVGLTLAGGAFRSRRRRSIGRKMGYLSILMLLLAGAASRGRADQSYAFTPITNPGALDVESDGINNSGLISGIFFNTAINNESSFLWQNGNWTEIDAPAGTAPTGTYLQAPGNSGLILADLGDANGYATPAIYNSVHGAWTYLPLDPMGSLGTALYGKLNAAGAAVGAYFTASADPNHYFANMIGHGLIWNGMSYDHFDVPGATSTLGYDINDAGQIIGEYDDAADNFHGFFKDGASYSDIAFPGGVDTLGLGLNNEGDVVGGYEVNGVPHGFVLSQGGYTTVDYPGAVFTYLSGINDQGDLTGAYEDAQGNINSFLATPVPEPGMVPLSLGLLLSGAALWRRQRR